MKSHTPSQAVPAPQGQAADGPDDGEGERIAKVLARAGVASRREVERLVEEGRVSVNGVRLTAQGVKVGPADIVTVDGKVVEAAEPVRVFRYNKPVGLVTTHNDPKGRPTVFAALPAGLPRLISVGRLDLNSEGLLLLTNDGGLSRALELPSNEWVRRYRARAFGETSQEALDRLKDGVTIEGVRYGPIEAKLDKAAGRNVWITLALSEGKNREVRRVLESIGLQVNRLIRLAYGPFALTTLESGAVEEVGPRVIRELLAEHVPEDRMPKGDRPLWKLEAPKLKAPPAGATDITPKRRGFKGGKSHPPTAKPAPGDRVKGGAGKAGAKAGRKPGPGATRRPSKPRPK